MSLRERLQKVKEEVRDEPRTNPGSAGVSHPTGRINVRPRVLEPQGKPEARQSSATKGAESGSTYQAAKVPVDPYLEVKAKIHSRLVKEIDAELLERVSSAEDKERLAKEVEKVSLVVLNEEPLPIIRSEKTRIINEVIDDVMGFGPITPLLEDETVTEIMVNGPEKVYVERGGRIEQSAVRFRDEGHVMHIIERIVAPIGRRIDEASPMVDARLPDGSRVNAVIPPVSLVGPCITIRKFSREPFTADDLINFGTLTPTMVEFLQGAVKSRLNIVVSGGTGSGKTTTLNVLSSFIPPDERIVTIEDAAELQLHQEHVVTLEARPPNIEGKGAIT
ncbi:MAG TPA: hypothetical protein DEQ54_04160, partial [Firmicutes bacterium]|nr:hypothetical protein [Bacillota bacterium]